ncbi:MAG: L,D-transpeptidase [Methylovirgula sp.]
MRRSTFLRLRFLLTALFGLGCFSSADALVRIHIDLSTQRMHVDSDDGSYSWPVSTARSGYVTPNGSFSPQSLQRMHYSHKYHMSPMPYSIFFRGGFAIHGTYETAYLGHPVSHGCVRLSPANAAVLFRMVKAEGAHITITGSPPRTPIYARRRERGYTRAATAYERPRPASYGFGFVPFAPPQQQSNPFW